VIHSELVEARSLPLPSLTNCIIVLSSVRTIFTGCPTLSRKKALLFK